MITPTSGVLQGFTGDSLCVGQAQQPAFTLSAFPSGSLVRDPPAVPELAAGVGLIPGSGRSAGGGKWHPHPSILAWGSLDREA